MRSIWLRHYLAPLKALPAKAGKDGAILSDKQTAALEQAKEDNVASGEIGTYRSGYLGAQDTPSYVGHIKGVERICRQTFIDTYARTGFAKPYDRKKVLLAAGIFNYRVLLFY